MSKHDPCRKTDKLKIRNTTTYSCQKLTDQILSSAAADREEVDTRPGQQLRMLALKSGRNGNSSVLLRPIDSTNGSLRPRSPRMQPRSSDSRLQELRLDDSDQSQQKPKSIGMSTSSSTKKDISEPTANGISIANSRKEFLNRCNLTLQQVQSQHGASQKSMNDRSTWQGSRIPIPTRLLYHNDSNHDHY